ncbi:MAG: VOC family protein [Ilumatobacteraceae bacterium]
MALRWYTTVVDARDVAALSSWWAEVLGWETAYEADDEVVLVPAYARQAMAEGMSWERTPPGLVFVAVDDDKQVKNRLHLDLAPHTSDDRDAEIERVLRLGATRVDVGQTDDATWDVFADPEGNEFCILSSRDV